MPHQSKPDSSVKPVNEAKRSVDLQRMAGLTEQKNY